MSNANRPKPEVRSNGPRIVVAAASARALAASTIRAGRPVSTIDLFADADTALICRESNRYLAPNASENFAWRCRSIDEIAQRLEDLLCDADFQGQNGPPIVLIGGGLERCLHNRNISRRILGQNDTVECLNSLYWRNIQRFCHRNSIAFPTSTTDPITKHDPTRWLVKTELSSGGMGVAFAQTDSPLEPDQYFQKYIEGRSLGACYVATPKVAGEEFSFCEMLGVSESVSALNLRTDDEAGDQTLPFRYEGSIGPINNCLLPETAVGDLERIGSLIANGFDLVGVFGIDFVLNQDGLWLLEINLRIGAAAELIEYAASRTIPDFSIVKLHLAALEAKIERGCGLIEACQSNWVQDRVFAKRIVYRRQEATQTLPVSPSFVAAIESNFGRFVGGLQVAPMSGQVFITDIPKPQTYIDAGQPLLTLHVSGQSYFDVGEALRQAFDVLEKIIGERLA